MIARVMRLAIIAIIVLIMVIVTIIVMVLVIVIGIVTVIVIARIGADSHARLPTSTFTRQVAANVLLLVGSE